MCFFNNKIFYHEKLIKENINKELETTKIELEQLKNKYNKLLKEKEDMECEYENLLKHNKNHIQELKKVLDDFSAYHV